MKYYIGRETKRTVYQMKSAFFINTGKDADDFPEDYNAWLKERLRQNNMKEVEADARTFLNSGDILYAILAYREEHKCTLREAKAAINTMQAEIAQ